MKLFPHLNKRRDLNVSQKGTASNGHLDRGWQKGKSPLSRAGRIALDSFHTLWWAGILDDPGLQLLLFMSFIPKIKWVINNTWSSRLLCFIYFLISVALVYNSLCWISSNWLDILLLLRHSPSHGISSLNEAPVTSVDRWGLNRLQR